MKNIKKWLSPILTSLFVVAFGVYFFVNIDSFKSLLDISVWGLVFIASLKILILFVQGVFIKFTVEVFTKKISLPESFIIASLSAIGNFFGPLLGGASIRAVYLKKKYQLPYNKFLSTLSGYYLIILATNGIVALIGLQLIETDSSKRGLTIFFIGWMLLVAIIATTRLPKRERLPKLFESRVAKFMINSLYGVASGWEQLKKQPKLLVKLVGLATAAYLVNYITNWAEFAVLDINTSMGGLGLYTALTMVSLLIAITPGSIGIRESIFFITSGVLGITNDEILQLAVVDRGVTYAVLLVLGVISRPMLKRQELSRVE